MSKKYKVFEIADGSEKIFVGGTSPLKALKNLIEYAHCGGLPYFLKRESKGKYFFKLGNFKTFYTIKLIQN